MTFILAMAACLSNNQQTPVEPAAPAEPVEAAAPAEPAPATNAGDWLVLESFDKKKSTAKHLPVQVPGWTAGEAVEGPAIAGADRGRAVAAHDGVVLFTVGEAEGGWVVRKDGVDLLTVEGDPPASMSYAEGHLFIGSGGKVLGVDLAQPSPHVLVEREQPMKSYDLFLRDGDVLVAVDDIMRPFWADRFELTPEGPVHRASWDLPGVVNGTYRLGAVSDGVVYLVAPFGVMSGHGHHLYALPFELLDERAGQGFGPGAELDMVTEMVGRRPGIVGNLVAGEQYTAWQGLVVAEGQVLACAGARGVLTLPLDLDRDTKAATVEIGGSCTDITRVEDTIAVLVDGSKLGKLAREADSWAITDTTTLDGSWTGFVR